MKKGMNTIIHVPDLAFHQTRQNLEEVVMQGEPQSREQQVCPVLQCSLQRYSRSDKTSVVNSIQRADGLLQEDPNHLLRSVAPSLM